MDAVNPDYLVVKMLHPEAPTEYWLPPGNLFLGRIPILSGMYSGSYTVYILAPFYLILGSTLAALRWAHLFTGLAILAVIFLFVREATRSLTIATSVCAVLAADPAFILPFRTQANITILPVFFALLGLYALIRYRSARGQFAAGVLLGLAVFGYFVFGFLLPGIAVFCLTDGPRRKKLLAVAAGITVGLLPYAFGYGLIFSALGFDGTVDWIQAITTQLHIDSHQSYLERAQSVMNWLWLVLDGGWDQITFWGDYHYDTVQGAKTWVLFLIPMAALAFALLRTRVARAFRLAGMATLSFVAVATFLGQRLGGHDLTPIVSLLYVCAAVAVGLLTTVLPSRAQPWALSAAVAGCAVLCAGNARSTLALTTKLEHDGAQGLYSSVFSDYPMKDAAENDRTPHVFFQWGALFQFDYLTNGQIPAVSGGGLKPSLCNYGKAKVVLTGKEVLAHPDIDFAKLGANTGRTEVLHDAYSGFPYEIIDVTPDKMLCGVSPAPVAPAAAVAAASSAPPPADALVLPTGIAPADAESVNGIYSSRAGQCCFLAGSATFPVRFPPGTHRLRFQIYPPGFERIKPQRLTFFLNGRPAKLTAALPKGTMATIDVSLPSDVRERRAVNVMIVAGTAFVPKDLSISPDTRTISVILLSIEPRR